jgi:hypothetical protein
VPFLYRLEMVPVVCGVLAKAALGLTNPSWSGLVFTFDICS